MTRHVAAVLEARCWTVGGVVTGRQRAAALEEVSRVADLTLITRTTAAEVGGQPVVSGSHAWAPLSGFFATLSAIRQLISADAVVVYLPGVVSLVLGPLAVLARRRLVCVVVGDPKFSLGPEVISGARGLVARHVITTGMRWLLRRADVVRYVTQRHLQKEYPAPCAEVFAATDAKPMSVAGPSARGAMRRPLRVITVGTLDRPYKGIPDLIQALEICSRSAGPVELLVVGSGRLQDHEVVGTSAADLTVSPLGQLTEQELADAYAEADLFALASWTEGLPRTLVEAMAAGLPCVATRVGGIPELLDAGALATPRSVASIASVLSQFLTDPTLRQEQGSRNKREIAALLKRADVDANAFAKAVVASDPARNGRGSTPVTVVQVFGAMDTGGAELRSLDVVRAFGTSDVRFEFVTLTGRRGTLAAEFEQAGATIVPMRLGPTFPFEFVRYLRRTQPEVLQSPVALFSGVILTLGRVARVPVRIAHFHSDGDGQRDTPLRETYRGVMRQLIHRTATHIIGVSPSALADGYGRPVEDDPRCLVVPNGVDAEALVFTPPASRTGTRVVALGRAAPEKNLSRMPAILAALLLHDTSAQLDIVGPRNHEVDQAVLAAAEACHVVDRVHLHDPRPDVGAVLAEADVLLLTSTREGLPSVVIEAAAVGLPVVSSDVGGSQWIAAKFPWVHCMSLDEPDDAWAGRVRDAVRNRPPERLARETFAASPFTLAANLASLRSIYGLGVSRSDMRERSTWSQ